MPGVLEGIRVLDFGRYIAGPFCGTMLGDLGAEVIRIEKLEGSEDRWVTPVTEDGQGAMFLQMGRNKRGLTLNPMKPAGREIVKKLVAVSDVVIANLPYEDIKKMGIDYDTLSSINPRIILATNSTFGSEGPYATRVGFDTMARPCPAPCTCRAMEKCRHAPMRRSSISARPYSAPSASWRP